jgi:hypothetical protein
LVVCDRCKVAQQRLQSQIALGQGIGVAGGLDASADMLSKLLQFLFVTLGQKCTEAIAQVPRYKSGHSDNAQRGESH